MNTLLFSVGIVVFMFTVYGTLVAGGVTLNRKAGAGSSSYKRVAVRDDVPAAGVNQPPERVDPTL